MDYWTPSKTLRLGIHTHSMGLQPPGRREIISTKGQFLRDLPTWKGVTAVQPAGINVVELNSMAPRKGGSGVTPLRLKEKDSMSIMGFGP